MQSEVFISQLHGHGGKHGSAGHQSVALGDSAGAPPHHRQAPRQRQGAQHNMQMIPFARMPSLTYPNLGAVHFLLSLFFFLLTRTESLIE